MILFFLKGDTKSNSAISKPIIPLPQPFPSIKNDTTKDISLKIETTSVLTSQPSILPAKTKSPIQFPIQSPISSALSYTPTRSSPSKNLFHISSTYNALCFSRKDTPGKRLPWGVALKASVNKTNDIKDADISRSVSAPGMLTSNTKYIEREEGEIVEEDEFESSNPDLEAIPQVDVKKESK